MKIENEFAGLALLLGLPAPDAQKQGDAIAAVDALIKERDELRATKGNLDKLEGEVVLWVQSGVNKRGEGFVQLMRNDQIVAQLSIDQAREVSANMLQCGEASLTDSLLIGMLEPVSPGAGVALVMQLRGEREKAGIKGPPTDPADFLRTEHHEPAPKPGEAKIEFPRTHDDA